MEAAAIDAFDSLRGRVLRLTMRVPVARRVFTDLSLRVRVFAVAAVVSAAFFAAVAPLVALWLSAAVLGVPHVVSGIRHLVLPRRVRGLTIALAGCGVLLGAAQLLGLGEVSSGRAFVLLFALSIAAEVWPHRTARSRWVLVALVASVAAALRFPLPALLALSHLHALSSIVFVEQRARARGVWLWPAWCLAGAVMLLAACGGLDVPMAGPLFAPRSALASISAEAVGSALGHPGPALFRRALFLYAFGQALHFTAWLKLVPELDRSAQVPQSLRVTVARFRRDFGAWTWVVVLGCVAATAAMLLGGGAARETYFALTWAHLGLEGAAVLGAATSSRSA